MFFLRACVCFSFSYVVPGCPSQFRVVDNIIALWQPPDQPNGNISGYEINVLYDDPTDGSEVRIDPIFFTSSSFFYVLRKGVVPENVTATIQVSSVNCAISCYSSCIPNLHSSFSELVCRVLIFMSSGSMSCNYSYSFMQILLIYLCQCF